jgi:hypothetical protein
MIDKGITHRAFVALVATLISTGCGSDDDSADPGGGSAGTSGSSGSGGKSGSGGANGGGTSQGGGGGSGGASGTGGQNPGSGSAADLARRLRGDAHFLIGMGNDLADDHSQDGAYTLGVTLDLHYAYLVGLLGQGGWPDWNAGGTFVNILADSADANGVTPMFTLYAMAASGESQLNVLVDDGYMGPYWAGAKLLFERLGVFDKPAVVHLEPDFWGFVQRNAPGEPTELPAHVGSVVPECAGLPETVTGMGRCLVTLSRMYAPKTAVGFHGSQWAADTAQQIADFMRAIGAEEADFIGVDPLDRDAGCFEAHVDPSCQRNDGPWYWDETNQTSPNFHEHLARVAVISAVRPVLWWQVPFGVPSDTPGGSPGSYRDNRVRYLFSHLDEFVAAGMVGAAFGVGAANQTYITTDGGQFQDAVTAYFANPTPLP